jgi:hypothetical protein
MSLFAGGLAIAAAALAFGIYRSAALTVGNVDSDAALAFASNVDVLDYVQVYAQGPQYLGYLLEQTGYGRVLYGGITLLASILHPVPAVGAAFRSVSGVTIYNELIYGPWETPDQIVPFIGELFLNLQLGGVILGYLIIGALTAYFAKRFFELKAAADQYMLVYICIWCLFLLQGSLAVVSQVALYALWPVYAYWVWQPFARRHFSPARTGSNS